MGFAMYGNDPIISHLGREKRNYKGFATNSTTVLSDP